MEEPMDFIFWIGIVPDPRIIGMVTYPLEEILLVGTLCRMEDWDEIVYFAEEQLERARRHCHRRQDPAHRLGHRPGWGRVFRYVTEPSVSLLSYALTPAAFSGQRKAHR